MHANLKGLLIEEKFFERTPDGPILVGSKCRECGKVSFPRKKVCTKCFKETMEVHPLARRGEIVTYSVAHMNHIGIPNPYAFGYVYLPEDGISIFTIFEDWEPAEERLFIGQKTELCYGLVREDPWGNPIVGYKHRCVGHRG